MDAKLGHPWTAETDLRWTVKGTPPSPPPEAWCRWIRTLLHGPAWILMHLVNVLSFLPIFPLLFLSTPFLCLSHRLTISLSSFVRSPPLLSQHLPFSLPPPFSYDLYLYCLNISTLLFLTTSPFFFPSIATSSVSLSPRSSFSPSPSPPLHLNLPSPPLPPRPSTLILVLLKVSAC